MNTSPYGNRELNTNAADTVTGGGVDCSGPGLGMGGLGHAIKQAIGAALNAAGTILGMF